jgi:predicted nucleic acid-binding Zn ribbon protein
MYIFRCRKCGEMIEIPDRPSEAIPCLCGGEFARLFTAPAVIYRCSGFYSKDQRLTRVKPEDYDPEVHCADDLR